MKKTKIMILAGVFAIAGVLSAGALSASAAGKGDVKPGWGLGDKNHVHVGPPGQSVQPTANGKVK